MHDAVVAVRTRTSVIDHVVPPKSGYSCVVRKGQHVRVTDIEGKQAGDIAFFNRDNTKEKNCNNLSRSRQFKPGGRYAIKDSFDIGDVIYSTAYRPMLTIFADTAVPHGRHEIELHSCNAEMFTRLGLEPPPHGGCWEILSAVLEPQGIAPEEISDTFDCFANLVHKPDDGEWIWEAPVTRPGDYLELRAEMDVIMGLSVCPMDFDTPLNGWKVTPLQVEVFDVEYWDNPEAPQAA